MKILQKMKKEPGASGRERGETQMGVILMVMGLGVFCWAVFSLQSCIVTHKDGKVTKRRQQYIDRLKPKEVKRAPSGYKVTIK